MTAALSAELKRYSTHTKRLQLILEDTKRCFDDINECGRSESGQLLSVELLQEEEAEVFCTAEKPPAIVVFGQNEYCKSRAVNEIFNRTIFPSFDKSDDKNKYRMVRFKHGDNLSISLALPDDYALVQELEAYNGPWNTIPRRDLQIDDREHNDNANGTAVLEVSFNHQILRHGCMVVVSACNVGVSEQIRSCLEDISPVLLYAFQTESLSKQDLQELEEVKRITDFLPVYFAKIPVFNASSRTISVPSDFPAHSMPKVPIAGSMTTDDLVSSEPSLGTDQYFGQIQSPNNNDELSLTGSSLVVDNDTSVSATQTRNRISRSLIPPAECGVVFKQLCDAGYLTDTPGVRSITHSITQDYFEVDSVLETKFDQMMVTFTRFVGQTLQRYLVNSVTVLNNTHIRCLNTFIISAFDMARDVLVTPKKLEFAREREEDLYKSLLQIAVDKGDEIKEMIDKTIHSNWDRLVTKAAEYDFIGVDFSETGEILTHKGLKICTGQIQELVLGGLNQAVAGELVNSVNILRDSYTGTLTRCLESLEKVERENPDNTSTTQALKQILNAAYQVEITVRSSSTFIHFLLERMKQIVTYAYRLELSLTLNTSTIYVLRKKMKKLVQAMPWSTPPRIDDDWKKKVASEMLTSLSPARLAKSISSQIKDRLNKSHEAFSSALKQLEQKHCGRLDRIEEERLKLRKVHAPRVAKVALESTSLKDLILHGLPVQGREIGRGQYGVVFACDSWAGHSPCAIKSVVPPDDKHWNDLALEFFYTKQIPHHSRIVALKGSVIDYMYGGGTTPAVLLVMDRLQRDLYTAIKQQLDWVSRIQVSIDVVEGIRFLHSQGLVHRDIKLKNVLLDQNNRGKITDLGFCKPEAMMSGSIVGTPIHMAPELFSGHYDNSVDVYAFGILFWYICAGNVRLPASFEQCANKDQLWSSVKRGLRPEKLTVFDDDCWLLMTQCWEGESSRRPHLGDVQTRLSMIYDMYRFNPAPTKTAREANNPKQAAKMLKYKLKENGTKGALS